MPRTYVPSSLLPEIEDDHLTSELKKLLVHTDSVPPTNPGPGALWFNPDTEDLLYHDTSGQPVSLFNREPASVGGIKFRVNSDTLEYSADGGQTWTALSGRGGGLPTTEDVYYVLTEDYPRPDLQEQGFDPLMVADGSNWEFVVNAVWATRYGHTSVITPDGKIWVIGGYDGSLRNDVWYSSNGSSWTQATSAASWTARRYHASVITPDVRIWVLGGVDSSARRNDVWYSSNGSSWTQATAAASWTARDKHTSVVTPDGRIWVMGGYDGSLRNDVWDSSSSLVTKVDLSDYRTPHDRTYEVFKPL